MCNSGFKACNEDWLQSADSAEFVTCIEESKDATAECPITSMSFSLSDIPSSD